MIVRRLSLPITNIAPENGWLEDEISFCDGLYSGTMLVSGGWVLLHILSFPGPGITFPGLYENLWEFFSNRSPTSSPVSLFKSSLLMCTSMTVVSPLKKLQKNQSPALFIYSFSHNHGSVENGCIWKVSTIGDTPIFHWTMIMGGRVSDGFKHPHKHTLGPFEEKIPLIMGI